MRHSQLRRQKLGAQFCALFKGVDVVPLRHAQAQSIAVNATGCGFDPHSN